jgi:diguanylate cyclase (GGDEF)-like protein/PAS domain S-box-containing protein
LNTTPNPRKLVVADVDKDDADDGEPPESDELARLKSEVARLQTELAASRASEERMALAIEVSGTGIWDRDVTTGIIEYSPGWKAILGYGVDEITHFIQDSYKRVHPDDLAYVQSTIQDHFDAKTPAYEVEHRLRCKDGSYKWVSSRGKVVARDPDGKPLRMIGTTSDITALRQMSEQLKQTVDLVTNLTNEVPGLVFQYRLLADGTSSFPYASKGIHDIYELEPARVTDSAAAIEAVIHPEDLAGYLASLKASAADLAPWHHEFRVCLQRQGVRWRQGNARPSRQDDGSTVWHGVIVDVTDQKRSEAELRQFATIDHLTELFNRRHFLFQMEAELARIWRDDARPAAILMFDLDHFKTINDRWGHAMGDEVLRHFASVLRRVLRKSDVGGRLGGEEFALLLPDTDMVQASAIARRIQQHIAAEPLTHGGISIPLTLSIGITLMRSTDTAIGASLARSDVALYTAKKGGRNRIALNP